MDLIGRMAKNVEDWVDAAHLRIAKEAKDPAQELRFGPDWDEG